MKNQLSTDSLTQEELECLRDKKELLEMDQRRIDGIWADAQQDIYC